MLQIPEQTALKRSGWLLAALPLLVHGWLLYRYSVNAPRLDDFSDGLSLIPLFQQASGWQDKLNLLFAMYQNHRWGVLHGIYFAFGCMDFRSANFLSLLPLAALPLLWWQLFRREHYATWLVIVASLLVFNLQAWTGLFWVTASLAAVPVIPLALLTFMLVTRDSWLALTSATIVATLATFTNGNGVTLWPLAALYLGWLAVVDSNRRHAAMLCSWLAISAVMVALYFSRQIFSFEILGTNNIHGALSKLLADPLLFARGFLAALGSIAMYHTGGLSYKLLLAITVGALELLAFAALVWRGALWRYPALILLALFLFGTCAAIGATRVGFIGIEQAFQGHYKLYNGTFLLIIASALLDYLQQRHPARLLSGAIVITVTAALLYLLSLWLFVPVTRDHNREMARDTRDWLHSNTLRFPETRFFVPQFNRKLSTAVQAGAYDPWTLVDAQQKTASNVVASCPDNMTAVAAELQSHKNAVAVHVVASLPQAAERLVLCSPRQAIAISLTKDHYRHNANGSYSMELWVPRNNNIGDDKGPWQLYLPR